MKHGLIIIIIFFSLLFSGYGRETAFLEENVVQLESTHLVMQGEYTLPFPVDWDNDNDLDLVVTSRVGEIALYKNQGRKNTAGFPVFEQSVSLYADNMPIVIPEGIRGASVADYNNDNKKDLLISSMKGYIYVFINNNTDKNPQFDKAFILRYHDNSILDISVRITSEAYGAAPFLIDWNNDGKKDLVCGYNVYTNIGTAENPAFTNNPSTNKANGVNLEINGTSQRYPFYMDWNNDNKVDILAWSRHTYWPDCSADWLQYARTRLFLNSGAVGAPAFNDGFIDANYSAYVQYTSPYTNKILMAYCYPTAGDFDGDNKKDLILGTPNGNIIIFKNYGTDDYPDFHFEQIDVEVTKNDFAGGIKTYLTIFDWNDDGIKDFIVIPLIFSEKSYVKVYINYGDNEKPIIKTPLELRFEDNKRFVSKGAYSYPLKCDWFNIGRQDIVMGGYDGRITVFSNFGTAEDPVFRDKGYHHILVDDDPGPATNLNKSIVDYYSRFELVDWNNDGLRDFVVGDYSGYLYLFLNQGTKQQYYFVKDPEANKLRKTDGSAILVDAPGPKPVQVLDFNGDGKKDLITGESAILVYNNIGSDKDPEFKDYETVKVSGIEIPLEYPSFYVTDFNDDDYWDIFVLDFKGRIKWYKGTIPRYINKSDEENLPEDKVYIAPNPVKDNETRLTYVVRDNSSITVEIYNLHSKKVKEYTGNAYFNTINEVIIDTFDLNNGVYFLRISAISLDTGQKSSVMKKLAVLK